MTVLQFCICHLWTGRDLSSFFCHQLWYHTSNWFSDNEPCA